MSKDWERAWSFDEIVENASNWSLAGDAGLLKNLEAFAENLFERTNKTNDNLNKLLDNLDSASIRLDLVKNEFLSLQNTQFVESRVYEDDETLQSIPESKEQKKGDNSEKMRNLRNAVIEGIEILDKYYEKVPVDASDTEDEVDFVNYVLRPKDPYLNRPLPYVIGSEEWHKNWHVGLQDSSSESEHEEEMDKFSDNDSEDNLPVPDRRRDLASTSDESDLSKPVASSTFNDTDSEDNNSMPAKDSLPKESFAEQLSARLGNVIVQSSREEPVEEINNRPIKPAVPTTNQRVFGDLFSNEPPPLDSDDEGTDAQGVFSGGRGLFDESDDENESFWGQKLPSKKQSTEDRRSNIMSSTLFKPENKISSGLFDDSDEDGIFADVKPNKSSYLKPLDNGPIFIDNEPPELVIKKKSGGTAPKDLMEEIKKKVEEGPKKKIAVESKKSDESKRVEEETKKIVEDEPKKRIVGSLFDEPVDLFNDDLFGDVSNSGLFGKDIFDKKKKFSGLFDNEDDEDTQPPSIVVSEPEKSETKTSKSLFDDDDDALFVDKIQPPVDDLFADKKPPQDDDLFADEKPPPDSKIPSLFDDSPPPDPDWDTTSQKNLFDDEDDDTDFLHSSTAPASSTQRFSLFDDEPPALDFHKRKSTNLFDEDDEDDLPPKDIFTDNHVIQEDLGNTNVNVVKSDINIRDKLMSAVKDKEEKDKEPVSCEVNGAGGHFANNDVKDEIAKAAKMFDEEEDDEWVDDVQHDIYSSNVNNGNKANDELRSNVKNDFEKNRDTNIPVDNITNTENSESIKTKENDDSVRKIDENVIKSNTKPKVVPRKTISLFEDPDDVSDDDLFSDKPSEDLFTNERKDIGKIGRQTKLFEDEDLQQSPEIIKSPPPGKLKHSLNINVAALMPGAAMPKRKEPEEKIESFPQDKEEIVESLENSLKSEEGGLKENEDSTAAEQQVEILYSVTKTRARIPNKRKPSSRKARQESMKKSASQDDDKNNNVEINDVVNKNVEEMKQEIVEPVSKTSRNLFDDDDDYDMFNEAPSSKPKVSKSLFDEEDDEDDLFKPIKKEKSKRTDLFNQSKQSSLFDDLSDDDGDIFNSKSKPAFNKSITKQTKVISKSKSHSLRKAEDCEVLEDPLDALNK